MPKYIVIGNTAYALENGEVICAARMPDDSMWDWETASTWGRQDDVSRGSIIRGALRMLETL